METVLPRKTSKLAAIIGILAISATLGMASPAFAGSAATGDKPNANDLTPQQLQAIDAWNSPQPAARPAPQIRAASSLAAASGVSSIKLFRGSWLMWAEDRVDYGYGNGVVTWSSGYQSWGAIFPNNVTPLGLKRIVTSSAIHSWRGQYSVGAGVPTPWGNANVYSATSTSRFDITSSNAKAWWVN